MPELSQAEYTRAVRGAPVIPGADPDIEPVVAGISSVARCAIRNVHRQSAASALAYFDGRVAKYAGGPAWATAQAFRAALKRYIAWDAAIGRPVLPDGIDVKHDVAFGSGNVVRTWCHVAVDDGAGGTEARIVLWDELRLNQPAAEMIALPILEAADAEYGAGSTSVIRVWQVATNQAVSVAPAAAQSRRSQIQSLMAGL